MSYAIVITAEDGTVSVCGPVRDEYRATLAANRIETLESGRVADVHLMEPLADVLAEVIADVGHPTASDRALIARVTSGGIRNKELFVPFADEDGDAHEGA